MDYSILKQQILDDIKTNPIARANSKALGYLIQNDKATYQTVADYSKILGDVVSESINNNIPDGVPDNELGAFANECLIPVYKQSQNTMLNACKSVQTSYNKQAEIGLNPAEVDRDDSRTEHIADRFNEASTFDDVKFLTNENVSRSITRGAVNDSIRENSRMQENAGLKIRISRSDGSGCCNWCSGLVGDYDSFDKLPPDFWKIHRNCSCVIDYNVGKTNAKIIYANNSKAKLSKITEKISENAYNESDKSGIMNLDLQHFAEDLSKQSSQSLSKGIKSLQKKVEQHQQKIANPQKYMNNWENAVDEEKIGTVKAWEKEIDKFQKQIDARIDELKKRGNYNE